MDAGDPGGGHDVGYSTHTDAYPGGPPHGLLRFLLFSLVIFILLAYAAQQLFGAQGAQRRVAIKTESWQRFDTDIATPYRCDSCNAFFNTTTERHNEMPSVAPREACGPDAMITTH
jgi:hypothetical protein